MHTSKLNFTLSHFHDETVPCNPLSVSTYPTELELVLDLLGFVVLSLSHLLVLVPLHFLFNSLSRQLDQTGSI